MIRATHMMIQMNSSRVDFYLLHYFIYEEDE